MADNEEILPKLQLSVGDNCPPAEQLNSSLSLQVSSPEPTQSMPALSLSPVPAEMESLSISPEFVGTCESCAPADFALNTALTTSDGCTVYEQDPVWQAEKQYYYTVIQLGAPGSAQVHWQNIIGAPVFLTQESDPVFSQSAAGSITQQMVQNWIQAYNWGNHADAGYLTEFFETDPTVPIWVKRIPQGTVLTPFLKWNGQDWVAVALSYNDLTNKPTIPDPYTDEMAQDAVGRILQDSPSIDLVYDDAGNRITAKVIDSYIQQLIKKAQTKVLRIQFRVGDNGYPQNGTASWTPKDASGTAVLQNKLVKVYREGEREYPGTVKGYTHNTATGTLTFAPSLYRELGRRGEAVIVEAYDPTLYEDYTPPVLTGCAKVYASVYASVYGGPCGAQRQVYNPIYNNIYQ